MTDQEAPPKGAVAEFLETLVEASEVQLPINHPEYDTRTYIRLVTIGALAKVMLNRPDDPDWEWATEYLRDFLQREAAR